MILLVTSCFAAGVDVNQTNHSGDTALWVACDLGSSEIVRALLAHPRIDINQGVAHVPLHSAVLHGHREIVTMLLEAGASVNKVCQRRMVYIIQRMQQL